MGEDQLDSLELDGPITLRVLDGIDWDFTQAKRWMSWKTVKCGGLISSCCPRNPHKNAGNEERKRKILPLPLLSFLGYVSSSTILLLHNFSPANNRRHFPEGYSLTA